MSEYLKSLNGSTPRRPTRPENRYDAMDSYEQKPFIMEKFDSPISGFASKFLPVLRVTTNLDDGVAIPPGVIVAAHQMYAAGLYSGGADAFSGIQTDGSIVVGYAADGGALSSPSGDRFDAYGENHQIIFSIANSGKEVIDVYTDLDVQVAALNPSGTAIAADDTINRPANLPLGVTPAKVMSDYRNRWQNSMAHGEEGDAIRVKGVIAIPFFLNIADTLKFPEVTIDDGTVPADEFKKSNVVSAADHASYNSLLKWTGFLYPGARTAATVQAAFVPGEYLVSDANGRFVPQKAAIADALVATKDAQVVGRLLQIDTKPYKDLKDLKQVYPDSGITGTDTYGIDSYLFNLAKEALLAGSGSATDLEIKALFDAGRVGVAHILIHIL